ncbi:MAG TPA: hypothetical protein V6D17_04285 [Candidatus Obscuribacterales bacterium]
MGDKAKEGLSGIVGLKVVRATSSLQTMAIELSEGRSLLIEAAGDATSPLVQVSTPRVELLPTEQDAVCAVDWGWIYGSAIEDATVSSGVVKLQLKPAGPLSVSVHVWQGKPFLAFQPFRPAAARV